MNFELKSNGQLQETDTVNSDLQGNLDVRLEKDHLI